MIHYSTDIRSVSIGICVVNGVVYGVKTEICPDFVWFIGLFLLTILDRLIETELSTLFVIRTVNLLLPQRTPFGPILWFAYNWSPVSFPVFFADQVLVHIVNCRLLFLQRVSSVSWIQRPSSFRQLFGGRCVHIPWILVFLHWNLSVLTYFLIFLLVKHIVPSG